MVRYPLRSGILSNHGGLPQCLPIPENAVTSPASNSELGFLLGGGEMGALMRSLEWSKTAVGAIPTWPQSLKTALSILLDSGYPMYIAWGPEFTQFYNDAYRPILGEKKHPAAMGQSTEYCFAEIWDFIGPMFQRVMREGKNTTLIDQLLPLDRNGYVEECYFTFSYSAIRDETGGVGGVLVTVIETTHRVLDERRQRTLRKLAAEALEASNAEDVMRRAAQTLDQNPHDLPFAWLYLTSPDTAPALAAAAGPQIPPFLPPTHPAAGLSSQLIHLPPAYGEVHGIAWPERVTKSLITPILDATQTTTTGYLVTGLSPRRALDQRYRAFLESVAEQIATAIVKVRAFEAERKRAEALAELDLAKTTFFSNVSHEFRTPLTLMLGPLEEILAIESLPQPVKHLASITYRNGLRLQKLVNALLDFSRIEVGRMQASFEPTDLAQLTAELTSTFRSAIEKAGIELQVDCPPLPNPIYVDREMWEKIVLNLLSNAFKYTLAGKIVVRLQQLGNNAILSVTDTGVGIPPHELPKLFERFHRVEGTQGRTQEGTGIGLALVSELIALHGGKVEATSEFHAGSTFTISIPTGTAHLPPDRLTTPQHPTSISTSYIEEAARWITQPTHPSQPGPSTRPKILIADDNADMRDYVARLLSSHYDVETVGNGQAALAAALHRLPDLVLTDVMMPVLDGFELLKAFRTNPATSALPVIMLSAHAGEEAGIEGLDAGANDYLVKPFTARELLARVRTHLEIARIRQHATAREEALRLEAQAARDEAVDILESITDGFFALDRDWRFTYVNHTGERILRASREELLGKSHWDLFPEAKGSIGEHEYRRAIRDQVPVTFELLYEPWQHWYAVNACPTRQGGLSVYLRDITESRRAVDALRESEQYFRHVIDSMPQLVWSTRPDGYHDLYNKQWFEYTGRSFEETKGEGWNAIFHPDDQAAAWKRWRHSLETGELYQIEYRCRRFDGQYRWFLGRATAIRDDAGRIVRWFGTCTDIDDQKQAEARLLKQWQTFDTALSNTPDHIYTFDLDAHFTYLNRAAVDFWGVTLEAALGKTPRDLGYPPERSTHLLHEIQQVVATRSPLRAQTAHTTSTGDTRHFDYILVPVIAPDGRVEAVAGSTRDITLRERMEQALAESEANLERVFAQAPVAIVAFRGRGFTVEMANSYYLDIINRKDIVGRKLVDVLPELSPDVWDVLYRVFDTGEPFVGNEWLVPYDYNRDGVPEDRWFNVVYNPLREFDGTVSGLMAVLTDVSAQVTARQELERVNRELEEFAYVASHDLQEPLRMVNTYTQLLMRRHISAENQAAQSYAGIITQGVRRMEQLITDLLSYSRSLNRSELVPALESTTADLNICWAEALTVLSVAIAESGAQITAVSLPIVRGDTAQLAHVFQNLLSNSLKYRKTSVIPQISVSTERRQQSWVIAVRDNGIGFEQIYADRIFGLFKRLHREEYPGTGLGLAICQRIVERYQGRIWAESELGVGSTFFIELLAAE